MPWRRKWQPTSVLLPGKFHGWRSLVGYSPWVHKSQTLLSNFTLKENFEVTLKEFPGSSEGRVCLQYWRPRCNLWVRKIPWRRKCQPSPVFLPAKSHWQRSLVDCSPWGCKWIRYNWEIHCHFLEKSVALLSFSLLIGFPWWFNSKNLPANTGDNGYISVSGSSLGEGNGNPPQYSFAWEIPWTEETGELQSMGSQRDGHDWATKQQKAC